MVDKADTLRVRDVSASELADALAQGRVLLVDVREPNETMLERLPQAVLAPMSSFDPARIPDPQGKQVVFVCRSGRRSLTASQIAQAEGFAYDAHLAGGLLAWKAEGRPTET